MLDLGQTRFHLAIPGGAGDTLESLSIGLFDEWEDYVDQTLTLSDYSLFLQIDEGSINGLGKIAVRADVLVKTIALYGSFFYGLEIIGLQLGDGRDFLAEQARRTFACPADKAINQKKGGSPAYLKGLFTQVQSGHLTVNEAVLRAQRYFLQQGDDAIGLVAALEDAFRDCQKRPVQLPLPLEAPNETLIPQSTPRNLPRQPNPKAPQIPVGLKSRVEVWRDSKQKRKNSKTSLI